MDDYLNIQLCFFQVTDLFSRSDVFFQVGLEKRFQMDTLRFHSLASKSSDFFASGGFN